MGLGLMTGHIKALLCLLLVVSVHELGHAALAVFFVAHKTNLSAPFRRDG